MLLLPSNRYGSDQSTVSDLTPARISVTELKYSSSNYLMVLDILVVSTDLLETRQRIRNKKEEVKQASTIFDSVKALTAMYHYIEI